MKLPDGSLRLNIIEAKAWSSRKVQAKNLSAFGLAKEPDSINRNIRTLERYINDDIIDDVGGNLTPEQARNLIARLKKLGL